MNVVDVDSVAVAPCSVVQGFGGTRLHCLLCRTEGKSVFPFADAYRCCRAVFQLGASRLPDAQLHCRVLPDCLAVCTVLPITINAIRACFVTLVPHCFVASLLTGHICGHLLFKEVPLFAALQPPGQGECLIALYMLHSHCSFRDSLHMLVCFVFAALQPPRGTRSHVLPPSMPYVPHTAPTAACKSWH